MQQTPSIAIVGAGFSGIALAVQLLRSLRGPAVLRLVNRNHRFGRGLAYGTRSGSHLLNVPAGRMSLDPADDEGFVRFLREQGLGFRAADFVPRKLYGDYLEAQLELAQAKAQPGVKLELVQAEVARLEARQGGGVLLHLDDGRTLQASEAVLALGNFQPQPPCGDAATWNSPVVANDPWAAAVLERLPQDAHVLLAGSGLTALDVVLTLLDRGHLGPITLLSRRGLLPHSHRERETAPAAGLVRDDVMSQLDSPRPMLRALRALVREAQLQGHDWRDVVGGLRPHTARLWQQLDAHGKRQFLRHLLPYWDTHRHRAAPGIHQRVAAAIASGQVSVQAGRLLSIDAPGSAGVTVRWRARGAATPQVLEAGAVINCTGPSSDLRRVPDALIRRLRDAGDLRVDALGLGLHVDDAYRVLRADGSPLAHVRYVGPLLKASLWEATAVPELRMHAARVAALVAAAATASAQRMVETPHGV